MYKAIYLLISYASRYIIIIYKIKEPLASDFFLLSTGVLTSALFETK